MPDCTRHSAPAPLIAYPSARHDVGRAGEHRHIGRAADDHRGRRRRRGACDVTNGRADCRTRQRVSPFIVIVVGNCCPNCCWRSCSVLAEVRASVRRRPLLSGLGTLSLSPLTAAPPLGGSRSACPCPLGPLRLARALGIPASRAAAAASRRAAPNARWIPPGAPRPGPVWAR